MRSWLLVAPPLSLTMLCLVVPPSSGGQTTQKKPNAPPDIAQASWAYFAKNCLSCHNSQVKSGSLDLNTLRGSDSINKHRDSWENIVHRVKAGEMPPKGSPRASEAETKAILLGIENAIDRADRATPPDPGAVTAHRLNRAEYNNTVRDLLGVDFKPADDFPQDDSGYGFDNIGDVLSLSSSQMEKYVSAAEKVSRAAVFGPEPMQPTLVKLESPRRIVTDTKIPAKYDTTGLDLRNSLHVTHRFPADGEYLFKVHVGGLRPLGSEAVTFAIWIDGQRVAAQPFDPTGQAAFSPDRQDFSGRTVEFKVRVPAGEHWLAATVERIYEGLPAMYNGPNPSKRPVPPPPEFKPRPGMTPERIAEIKKRIAERAKEKIPTNDVRVNRLDVGGPYEQTKGPSEASLRKIFVCGHVGGGHTDACTPKIVGNLARRAFRRPVTAQEVSRLSNLVTLARKNGDSYEEGVCLAVQGILVSPHFLFRIMRDPANVKPGTPHNITQHELASRLSYFLWSTMPDDELRACADKGTLRKPEVLEAQVKRMLKDPRTRALSSNFGGQWLQFRALESAKPDRERFPDFDEYLRMSMREETERFLDSVIRDDRSVLDLISGKFTYLNGRLANFYGIPGVEGPAFRKVSLAGTNRGGVITHGSVLTVTSYPNRTSPVLRGKWILENILNAPPPAPPPDVPTLDESTVGTATSLRKQLEEHRKNPTCASCHSRMDPLGFGLENFDAIGAWRKADGKVTIDSSGSLPDGRTFDGPNGLATVLKADRDAFVEGLTTKLLTYALGRGLERYDRPTVKDISKRIAAKEYRFSSLVMEIVTSRPFQMRKGRTQ